VFIRIKQLTNKKQYMDRQELADKLTANLLSEIYGERFTQLDNLEDDEVLDDEWEYFNSQFYSMLKYYYGDDEVLKKC
jgi:hypothetical protein